LKKLHKGKLYKSATAEKNRDGPGMLPQFIQPGSRKNGQVKKKLKNMLL